MKAIAAVDQKWGIGYKGNLLEYIPEDLKFFKAMTMGKVVIMGRETLESLPGGQPLKDRVNIVLTRKKNFEKENVIVCCSLDELFQQLENYKTEEVFVIGGETIYDQLIEYCTDAFITKIHKTYTADKYIKNLDADKDWVMVSQSEIKSHNDTFYTFVRYVKNS